jgi:hypothetical protein
MPRLRVHGFSLSLDGYAAGPNQDLGNPIGVGASLCTNGPSPPELSSR